MPNLSTTAPARRRDLILSQINDAGNYVVKDPQNGTYYDLGPEEAFLLEKLDGTRPYQDICSDFGDQFGEPLQAEELDDFVDLARSRGFLRTSEEAPALTNGNTQSGDGVLSPTSIKSPTQPAKRRTVGRIVGKALYWRTNFFDPDRFFTWLEPRIQFVWTRGFIAVTACMIALALFLLVGNFRELVHLLPRALHWETLVLAWIILGVVTFLHEFAHGLTCKHYGGEVHEVGFLLMFFMPCFYCNVSDAWLFREKRKRLVVMLAGGYCDLILWSLAVFVWRLTHSQTIVHYVACVVLSICGGRVILNFNPLMRLDGYYLLSDWAEIPNLRQRSWTYVMGYVRHFLWGAPVPEQQPRAHFLFLYGALSWTFAIMYVGLFMLTLIKLGGLRLGIVGIILAGAFAVFVLRNLVSGIGGGEIVKMFMQRHKRATVWGSVLLGIPVVLFAVPREERAAGSFQVRSVNRVELRAKVSGFLESVSHDEGESVTQDQVIARLQVPDLVSRTKQKEAEVTEAEQQLKELVTGSRKIDMDQQEARVARAQRSLDLAKADLDHARQALQEELRKLDQQVNQYRAEFESAREAYLIQEKLWNDRVGTKADYLNSKTRYEVAKSQLDQAISGKKEREATGTQTFEAQVDGRQKDFAEADSTYKLMKEGTRSEKVEAARARHERLKEELAYLTDVKDKLEIRCPIESGLVVLPRQAALPGHEGEVLGVKLSERVGQYFHEGELICVVEDPSILEVDIAVDEQEAANVQSGQLVDVKVRALPFKTFTGTVDRIAPNAVPGEVQSTICVYCRLENPTGELKSGMSGHARVHCGKRQLGVMLVEKVMRYLRTELWW